MDEGARTSERPASATWSLLFFLCLLVLWQLCVPFLGIPRYLLPTPLAIVEEFGNRGGFILAQALPTFVETTLGFLLGVTVGIGAGLGIVYSRLLWLTMYPALVVLGSVPRIAIAPLILIWLGLDNLWSKATITFLVAFFPLLVNAVVGFSQIEEEMLELAKTMGMSRWTEFRKIRFPHAMPYLFAGGKASMTLAVIGAVVAEFVAGQQGLGYLIIIGNNELNAALIFAAITVLSVMSLGLFGLIVGLEKWLMPWRRGMHPTEL
jgi:NitT/TauT family transport system permease protein